MTWGKGHILGVRVMTGGEGRDLRVRGPVGHPGRRERCSVGRSGGPPSRHQCWVLWLRPPLRACDPSGRPETAEGARGPRATRTRGPAGGRWKPRGIPPAARPACPPPGAWPQKALGLGGSTGLSVSIWKMGTCRAQPGADPHTEPTEPAERGGVAGWGLRPKGRNSVTLGRREATHHVSAVAGSAQEVVRPSGFLENQGAGSGGFS